MKLVMTADTHRKERLVKFPKGDILIHAGDYDIRTPEQLKELNEWFGSLKFKHIICIAGNHDFYIQALGKELVKKILTNAVYLEDESVTIKGIKFYGTPWTSIFGSWAYMLSTEDLKNKFDNIPRNTDVLISHGPCYGILDYVLYANGDKSHNVGSVELLDVVKEVKPKIHVCGHIHESAGKYTDGKTDYYNVSFVDFYYTPTNEPVVVNI